MAGYAQVMTNRLASLTRSWSDGQDLDVLAETQAYAMTTLAETMFAQTLSPSMLRESVEDLGTVAVGAYQRMIMVSPLDRLPIPSNRRYDRRPPAR